jgi:hypothetical protein
LAYPACLKFFSLKGRQDQAGLSTLSKDGQTGAICTFRYACGLKLFFRLIKAMVKG